MGLLVFLWYTEAINRRRSSIVKQFRKETIGSSTVLTRSTNPNVSKSSMLFKACLKMSAFRPCNEQYRRDKFGSFSMHKSNSLHILRKAVPYWS
jgi:hypothetical protein